MYSTLLDRAAVVGLYAVLAVSLSGAVDDDAPCPAQQLRSTYYRIRRCRCTEHRTQWQGSGHWRPSRALFPPDGNICGFDTDKDSVLGAAYPCQSESRKIQHDAACGDLDSRLAALANDVGGQIERSRASDLEHRATVARGRCGS